MVVKILIVEDEMALREGLRDLMEGDGHTVQTAEDGARAVELGIAEPFDVVLLDVMLPKLSGMEVCRRLRRARPTMRIIMLTARGSEDDKVAGLCEGADDYVTKPFAARELLARVQAVGRRHQGEVAEVLCIGALTLNLSMLQGKLAETEFSLSAREAGIIRFLLSHHPTPVSRAQLLEAVWGARGDLETRSVDMAVATLRKKIEEKPARPRCIVTVKGVGYRWGG